MTLLAVASLHGCKSAKSAADIQESHSEATVEAVVAESSGAGESEQQWSMEEWWSQWSQYRESISFEQATEQVVETITTVTDSLGNTTRTEQRATTRSASAHNTQNSVESASQGSLSSDSLKSAVESYEGQMSASKESASSDEVVSHEEKESEPSRGAWWHLYGLLMVAVIIAAGWWCYKKFLKPKIS